MSQQTDNQNVYSGSKGPNLYGPDSHIVDFILGITYEIWEQRQVERIYDYYSEDVQVYALEGITVGADRMVEQTHRTLEAFPNRLLLGDKVISSGDCHRGFSSHRLTSPMTNRGATVFGPATGRQVQTTNIADCEINEGRISREWLIRDNRALTEQLGLDALDAARGMAKRFDDEVRSWHAEEYLRTANSSESNSGSVADESMTEVNEFARRALECCWQSGDQSMTQEIYAPYCVMRRAPLQIFSGREQVSDHYARWRGVFPDAHLSTDNICFQQTSNNIHNIAVRWSVAATHQGAIAGVKPTGKPIYLMGVTHWKVVDARIVAEWTVFDELAVIAQALDRV